MRAQLLAAAAVLTLGACQRVEGEGGPQGPAPEPASATLAEALGDGDFGRLEEAVETSGLQTVLDGVGPYTVFAPGDAAFDQARADLSDEALRAQAIALLRAHMVPGALTRSDMLAALAQDDDGRVEIRTLADGLLVFSREGDTLQVTGADGRTARLTGEERLVENGVVQPVDGLLVPAGSGEA